MTDYMAQMLNELMGSSRDAMPGEQKEVHYDDPQVCTDFLVGFCTHELFRNTKNDLGFCKYKLHDESLRKSYQSSGKRGKLGFEQRFLERLRRIQEDVQRKISKNEDRLAKTQGDSRRAEETFEKKLSEIAERREVIVKRIEVLMEQAQNEGESGNVAGAQEAVERADRAKQERESLDSEELKLLDEKNKAMSMEESVTMGNRQMQVCNTCGCFMLQNDAQQRVDDHISGKLHIAYETVRETIQKVETDIVDLRNRAREEFEKDERRKDKEREERRKERRRSRSRDRHDRDRRDNRHHNQHHDHHHSHRRDKDRSRERESRSHGHSDRRRH